MRINKRRINSAAIAVLVRVVNGSIIRVSLGTADNGFLNSARSASYGTPELFKHCDIVSVQDKMDERQEGKFRNSESIVYVLDTTSEFDETDRINIGGQIVEGSIEGGTYFKIDMIDREYHFFGLLVPALYISEDK